MNIKLFRPKLYIYQKIIFVFAALIIPIYLVNMLINTMGVSFIKQEFSNSIQSNVKFYSNQLADQISFIRNQQLQFLNDSDLQKLSFLAGRLEGFEELQLVNRIKERLSTIQNSSDYLVNAGVYTKSFGKTISTQAGVNNLPNREYEVIEAYQSKTPKPSIFYNNGRLFIIESVSNSSIIVYLELSIKQLEKTLNQLVENYNDSGAVLTDEHNSYHISPNYEESIMKAIQRSVPKEQNNTSVDNYTLKVGNQSYIVTHNRISFLGLTLFSYMKV
jgi:two-component system sensor histidine kinase YesM